MRRFKLPLVALLFPLALLMACSGNRSEGSSGQGDTLLFRVELLHPVRHGVSTMKGYVFVGDHVVSEAQFTAQIVKNK